MGRGVVNDIFGTVVTPHVAFGEAPPMPGGPEPDKTLRCCPFCGSGDITGNSDRTVTCGFCTNRFQIILESPHPFMPSALDGVPGPEIVTTDGTKPLEAGNGLPPMSMDPNVDPDAPGADEPGLEGFRTDGPAAGAQAGATLEQFRVARRAAARYLTGDGVLPEDEFVRHLALRFADDRDAVLPQIRQEHKASSGNWQVDEWMRKQRTPIPKCPRCGKNEGTGHCRECGACAPGPKVKPVDGSWHEEWCSRRGEKYDADGFLIREGAK